MKKYYSTTVQELGEQVNAFKGAGMLIMFNENAPQELREYCILHRGNKLEDTVQPGDIFKLGDTSYKVVFVGNQVQKNLKDLGHITLRSMPTRTASPSKAASTLRRSRSPM